MRETTVINLHNENKNPLQVTYRSPHSSNAENMNHNLREKYNAVFSQPKINTWENQNVN
jgi:hypothetical protein